MSFENSPFAKSLYLAGTPKKSDSSFSRRDSNSPRRNNPSPLSKQSVNITRSESFSQTRSPNKSNLSNTSLLSDWKNTLPGKSIVSPNTSNRSSFLNDSFFDTSSDDSKISNNSVWNVSTHVSSTTREVDSDRFSSIDGTPLKTPPNTYSISEKEKPTGVWEHPLMRQVLNRQINKEQVLRRALINAGVLIAFTLFARIIRTVAWDAVFADPDVQHDIAQYSKYVWYALWAVLWYNIITAFFQLAFPQDQCEDLPLTNQQRKLLGLPPSPKASPETKYTPPKYFKSASPSPLSHGLRSSRKSFDLAESPSLRRTRTLSLSKGVNTSTADTSVTSLSSVISGNHSGILRSSTPEASSKSNLLTSHGQGPENGFSPSARFLYRDSAMKDKISMMSRT